LRLIQLNVVAGFASDDVLALRGNSGELALQLLMQGLDGELPFTWQRTLVIGCLRRCREDAKAIEFMPPSDWPAST
jgi:hypothetical protein